MGFIILPKIWQVQHVQYVLTRPPQSLGQLFEIPIFPKLLLILKNIFDSGTRILQLGKISRSMLKTHRNYGLFPAGFISSETPKKAGKSGTIGKYQKKWLFFNVSIPGRYRFRGPRRLSSCSEYAQNRVDILWYSLQSLSRSLRRMLLDAKKPDRSKYAIKLFNIMSRFDARAFFHELFRQKWYIRNCVSKVM